MLLQSQWPATSAAAIVLSPATLLLASILCLSIATITTAQAAPQPPQAQPPPSPGNPVFLHPTSCASATGVWTVGDEQLSKGYSLTFVKSYSGQPNEVFRFPTSDIDQNFTPGKCVETSPTTVYFLSDYFQGGTMTVNSTTKNGTWSGTSSQTEPDMFQLKDLKAATFALSLNATAQSPIPIVVVATPNNQIYKWATSAKATSLVATLADLEIPSTQNILGMEMSWAGSTGFVWIHYTDKNQQAVLLRVNTASKEEKQPFLVDPSQILLPLSSGNGVALLGANSTSSGYILSKFPNTGAEKPLPVIIPVANAVLKPNTFVVNDTMVWQINSNGASANPISYTPSTPAGSTSTGVSTPTSSPVTSAPASGSNSRLPVIIGSVVGALALVVIVAFILIRRRNSRGNWSKKQKGLFPAKGDESMVPLGLYHQNRSLPEPPRYLENDLERLGHAPRPGNGFAQAKYSNNAPPYLYSRNPTESHLDESIPVEAALAHHRYDKHTPQGLTHSISVSSTTSKFPRRNVKSGKRFEEKIQLQVIRYEIPDAHLISPHGPTGRLVLGTYHVVSPARSARSIKAQGGASQGMARSGTVVVRRSRMDFGHGRSASSSAGRAMSPLQELSENSSMLLTDAENQHTFEVATLKWYMTEIHWKREAALLKHLKSPIFVMELLESYCIPALQNRAHTYPFVNAMGGCSSLLSDIKPIKTAQHARAILRSISAAVDWCHRHGVVHLNLQPGSFFLEDGIDPSAEDAPWKLWDFTCARFMGEPIGPVGGGGEDSAQQDFVSTPQPPLDHLNPETYPILEQRQLEERMDRIGGNPLPAAYTAPELLEAWRARDTTFPAEAGMDTWSLGCVYYEILTGGQPLFPTEAEAWALVGGWENRDQWASKDFRVPYPCAGGFSSGMISGVQDGSTLDPSGSIAQLLHDMMAVPADERISLETIMERIY